MQNGEKPVRIVDLMQKLTLLWPRKFNGEQGAAWFEAYRAAVGHAEGEKLETAWQRFMEGGIKGFPPTPKDLQDLIPVDRSAAEMGGSERKSDWKKDLEARRAPERQKAFDWLMTWWKPLIDLADAKAPEAVAKSVRHAAWVQCSARAEPVADAWRRDLSPALCDKEKYAGALWWAMHRNDIPTNRIDIADMAADAIGMWRQLHAGGEDRQAA